MKEEINSDQNNLIGKFLAGEAKPDEAMELDLMLKDPAMQKQYEETLKLWKALPASVDTTLPDLKDEWKNLQGGLKPVKSISNFYKYLAVASVTSVIVIASLYMLFKSNNTFDNIVGAIAVSESVTAISNATKVIILHTDSDNTSIDRITGSFDFKDLPLTEAIKQLEKTFNVKMDLDRLKFVDCRITAVFTNKPLSYILDIINITFNTTHTTRGQIITIDGKGCN